MPKVIKTPIDTLEWNGTDEHNNRMKKISKDYTDVCSILSDTVVGGLAGELMYEHNACQM